MKFYADSDGVAKLQMTFESYNFYPFLAKEIVILQEDGKFSTTSLLKHKNGIGNEQLENFTFCIRYR